MIIACITFTFLFSFEATVTSWLQKDLTCAVRRRGKSYKPLLFFLMRSHSVEHFNVTYSNMLRYRQ